MYWPIASTDLILVHLKNMHTGVQDAAGTVLPDTRSSILGCFGGISDTVIGANFSSYSLRESE